MNIPALNVEAAADPRSQDASSQLVAQFARASASLPGAGNAQIDDLREDAIAEFAVAGLPNRRVEQWKYTDLRRMMSEAYPPASAKSKPALTAAQVEAALGEAAGIDAVKLVFVNGALRHELSDVNGLPAGVSLTTLAEALKSHDAWVLAVLGRTNPQAGETVTLLNTAFMSDGVVLRLEPGAKLDRPVHLIHVTAGDTPLAATLRNIVVAGEGSEAAFIESYVSAGATPAQLNVVTELSVGPGAKLRHYKLSGENKRTQHLSSAMVELSEGADYLAVNFADGTELARHQTFLKYAGKGARAHFYGTQLLVERQHCDMTLIVNHDAVGCESREHVKAVLADHAQGVFQAKVIVQPGAQQTDGRQMAQALLLSDNAEFDAKPELEIYADDVKCNHGATSGALDDDLMFYLRARGIPEIEARSLLIQAFIGEVLDQVEHEGLRDALSARAARWLA
ncbi:MULTISPECIES: Fe-S cluster assembly protein SufD [Rhodomicrobium]|uniref:Fe-S cluster assembly protein SufD n=1 Tax=Rhodomicrobium TaxID=1068 RepID=UPI000F7429E1|nr:MULTISPECIES: Fe-S cluster assembly protein SufD [Rhodomicrobium]